MGDVVAKQLSRQAFGVFQVTSADEVFISAYALAWYAATPPTPEQAAQLGPMTLDHHDYKGGLAHANVQAFVVPQDLITLCNTPVPVTVPAMSNVYSSWLRLFEPVLDQQHWDLDVPDAAKRAYQQALARTDVVVDFGAGPISLPVTTPWLDFIDKIHAPPVGDVRWSAADALPRLSGLTWSGPERGVQAAMASRPHVRQMKWRDAPHDVDLRDTSLRTLEVAGPEVRRLWLPPDLWELTLAADVRALSVSAPEDGRWLTLYLDASAGDVVLPRGLEGVRHVAMRGSERISVAALRVTPSVRELDVFWDKPPGNLEDADVLAELRHLASLDASGGYGLDADQLDGLNSLTQLSLAGLRRSVATELRARLRGKPVKVTIRDDKPDAWLAENLTNPLRDWVDDDETGGVMAAKAYTQATSKLSALPTDTPHRETDVEQILHTMMNRLNVVQARFDFVDSYRRGEAYQAFTDLARRSGIPEDTASAWFEEWSEL